ncbi:class I SAM-dependent methyltransferase [Croceicoccus bisphenolivorans]|uniref:class I SAM-dependent methyltransferase n=1 Tax=Croceicoccus bisphenolivorans TaxID=1783232 RepID=UPI000833C636|nr:class I SAM-dependent methyltransferase [Croceicoccus bisphenolivorans]
MTSRETTALRALREEKTSYEAGWSDTAYRVLFGAIGWPWLLYSLWGGTKASKRQLLNRVDLPEDALPNLGSWKADTFFLHRIVATIEELRPATVVELGAGASSLVCARALQLNGGGRLHSYDQHAQFVSATREWLDDFGVTAQIRHAPLGAQGGDWPGAWYELSDVPASIDLLIIDGPPWAVHPFVRGAAEILFDRLSPGAVVLLDDAARPGERLVAQRWKQRWPQIAFEYLSGGSKGTLIGRKRTGNVLAFPVSSERRAFDWWKRAAAVAALFATGWLAHDVAGDFTQPAHAANFVDEANASYSTSLIRQSMQSQVETEILDRAEIGRSLGILLPGIPNTWHVSDVQVFPSDGGNSVALALLTDRHERVLLYARRAETPAEAVPLAESRNNRTVAYWETGPFAYALAGELDSARILLLASDIASVESAPARNSALTAP